MSSAATAPSSSRWRRNGSASSDRPAGPAPGGRIREAERAELERLRREMSEKNKRIRELEMERDVLSDAWSSG
ncbi:hypothetical protein [Streptomyces sp. NPDC002205]|uniref:hypothetical protein n=1 Tax=Streptomyces sp. NPDC002205 TaxID=3154411 RepID=UPI003321D1C0